MNLDLSVLDYCPEELLELKPNRLGEVLEGPTLLKLKGRQSPPVFVSVLLHGNEWSGFYAVQELLRDFRSKILPRDLWVFFGNIAAASEQQRYLDGQKRLQSHLVKTGISLC